MTAEEHLLLETGPLPYSVAVALWPAGDTAKTIAASGAFHRSRLVSDAHANHENLIATPLATYCNSAVIPVCTMLSVELVPTVFEDQDCIGFDLARSAGLEGNRSVRINFSYKGKVVMGWHAVIVAFGW